MTAIRLRAVGVGSKAVLHFSGDVNFGKRSDVFAEAKQDNWHAMLFIGARNQVPPTEAKLPDSEKGTGVLWRVYQSSSLGRTSIYNQTVVDASGEVTMTNSYYGGGSAEYQGVPFASNWTKLDVEWGSATNDMKLEYNSGMKLKMQGALVQYDVVSNVSDQLDLRRWGGISNTIDQQGSCYITAKNVAVRMARILVCLAGRRRRPTIRITPLCLMPSSSISVVVTTLRVSMVQLILSLGICQLCIRHTRQLRGKSLVSVQLHRSCLWLMLCMPSASIWLVLLSLRRVWCL